MNLSYLKLIQQINKLLPIPQEQFNIVCSNENTKTQLTILINLIQEGNIHINHDFQYVLNYCNTLSTLITQDKQEQRWIGFYLYLFICSRSKEFKTLIIQQFLQLPEINTDKPEIQWIQYKVYLLMLNQYLAYELDYSNLTDKISEIPSEIKSLFI